MKKDEIPQDPSALQKFTREVCYAVDESGNYTTALSSGWKVKADALGIAWQEAERRINQAREKVKQGEASPLLYFMEMNLMDIAVVAAYTGFWQWTVKRHLKPAVFKKLPGNKLKKYADIFGVSVEALKNITADGG